MGTFKPKRVIILASGYSMKEAIDNGLWDKIKNEFTININYNFMWFESTAHFFGDWKFYRDNKVVIDRLPIVMAMDRDKLRAGEHKVQDNVYLIKRSTKYNGDDSLRNGCYPANLSGPFLLSVCIALRFKEIFLVGMDWGDVVKDGYTHFYQNEFQHRGVGVVVTNKHGKVGKNYNTNNYGTSALTYFKPYEKELNKIKIMNVSPNSKIESFPKISYSEFFKILEEDEQIVLQERAREWLRKTLEPYRTNK